MVQSGYNMWQKDVDELMRGSQCDRRKNLLKY